MSYNDNTLSNDSQRKYSNPGSFSKYGKSSSNSRNNTGTDFNNENNIAFKNLNYEFHSIKNNILSPNDIHFSHISNPNLPYNCNFQNNLNMYPPQQLHNPPHSQSATNNNYIFINPNISFNNIKNIPQNNNIHYNNYNNFNQNQSFNQLYYQQNSYNGMSNMGNMSSMSNPYTNTNNMNGFNISQASRNVINPMNEYFS